MGADGEAVGGGAVVGGEVVWGVGVEVNMVSKKNKRKIIYEGINYYWYVRVNEHSHRVHIISEDKKVRLEHPFLDTEIPVTPQDIRNHLKEYYANIS